MTETDLGIGTIIFALAVLSLADFVITTASVWAAARIFRYGKKDLRPAFRIAVYSLKYGLVVATPFVLVLYLAHPALEDILAKGPRLLLPLGLVFLVKTSAIFWEMKKVYGVGVKKIVNGYATAAYLMFVAWIMVVVLFSMMMGFYGILSIVFGDYSSGDDASLTGWWDLMPELPGNYSASSSTYSAVFRNDKAEPIKFDSALVVDLVSQEECNVSSPIFSEEANVNGTFILNATCPPANISAGDPYELAVEIRYTTVNNPLAPLYENDYVSGNASA
ncbi:MAG: hypothetical protein WAX07_04225 [Candidatus Altiarchaeia archaeon]